MPTPRGKGLAGDADGGQEGWQEKTLGRVFEREARAKAKSKRRPASILLEFDIPYLTLLRRAAESRGMSSAGYARRAVAAFIAHDLGLGFSDVTRHCSAPFRRSEALTRNSDKSVRERKGQTFDDGTGYGTWDVR